MKSILTFLILYFLVSSCTNGTNKIIITSPETLFNNDWEFIKDVDEKLVFGNQNIEWEKVSLPHTANIEPLVIKGKQWMGTCYYRKQFSIPANLIDKHIALKFDGAMQVADVYLNGNKIMTHFGGYLPFYVPLNKHIIKNQVNTIVVKLNNEDNPEVPPGKPIDELDFNIFSGIYRNVWLIVKDKLHISDPIGADRVAGGGIFVTFKNVTYTNAVVSVKSDINNYYNKNVEAIVQVTLKDKAGRTIKSEKSPNTKILGETNQVIELSLEINKPQLWSPHNPYLYTLIVDLIREGEIIETISEKIGVRTFKFTTQGFELNGQPFYLRGTNRHQEYPYIGYALSDNANYRDAYKIKEAGFNFVRLSHYPHSKSFMNACDELGLLVMDAIPGWQFYGNSVFQQNVINDIRKMVRRDRNHACVILWEASLNESGMPVEFMQKAHNTVHEEYPTGDVYTCGWIDKVYDVFIPARQHAKPPLYWSNYKKKPVLIAEYGDWEYYAQNAGFNQTAFKDLSPEERNSRQLRGFGQKRLAQQALNYQESHNCNLKGAHTGDANWLMYDYNRGYAPDIEASGIMDIFRLPKFAYYFYKSQAKQGDSSNPDLYKPFVEIANYYNDPSFLDVKVYSNCNEVELFVNGKSLGKKRPDNDINSTHLASPPFTFTLPGFVPGEISAKGYIDGKTVATSTRKTPGNPSSVIIWVDESNRKLQKGVYDIAFLYAAVTDNNGTIIPDASNTIAFKIAGDAELIGSNPIDAEAGIATILLKIGKKGGTLNVLATSHNLKQGKLKIRVK